MTNNPIASVTRPEDMQQSRAWTAAFFSAPDAVPVAFTFDGQRIRGIPRDWNPTAAGAASMRIWSRRSSRGRETRSGLRLRVECVAYADYPVVEWTAWFTNEGAQPTPILADILGLDATFAGETPILWHSNGDFCSAAGYAFQETPLRAGEPLRVAPDGGRPCDHAFPYFRVAFKTGVFLWRSAGQHNGLPHSRPCPAAYGSRRDRSKRTCG